MNKKIAQKPPKSRTVIREKSEQKFVEAPETAYMTEKSMIKLKKAFKKGLLIKRSFKESFSGRGEQSIKKNR